MTDLKAVPARHVPHARGLTKRAPRGLFVKWIPDEKLDALVHPNERPGPELLNEWIRRQQLRAGALDRLADPAAVVLLTHEVQ